MRGLWLILVFALLPLSHALEQDAALAVILNDTITTQTMYTKLFKVSNKHPSQGKLDVSVSYVLRKNGEKVVVGSFAKTLNRYTTVDTGTLTVTEPGEYVLCGQIMENDAELQNNEACKTIIAVGDGVSQDSEQEPEPWNKPSPPPAPLVNKMPSATKKPCRQCDHLVFVVNATQVSSGIRLAATSNVSGMSYSISIQKSKKKVYGPTFLHDDVVPYLPEKDGLYTLEVTAHHGAEQRTQTYSLFLTAPHGKKSPTGAVVRQQSPVTLPVFGFFFVPLLFLAAYIVIKEN
ncbi:hypothetical protein HY639_05070 [Candidatus Woesearchaeota archaeon]|nr:hypothetical protein [Candidatus Woesearchaeota archaeon]